MKDNRQTIRILRRNKSHKIANRNWFAYLRYQQVLGHVILKARWLLFENKIKSEFALLEVMTGSDGLRSTASMGRFRGYICINDLLCWVRALHA